MQAGEYPSVRRAAMDAGIVKPTVAHGVSAEAFARAARKLLMADQIDHALRVVDLNRKARSSTHAALHQGDFKVEVHR